jgi:hypothetical protein
MKAPPHDPVRNPAHYTIYPVQPIALTRYLGFCLGNAVKYVLRAPYKGGAEDLKKALQYLEWEIETPCSVPYQSFPALDAAIARLDEHLRRPPLDVIRELQADFLMQIPSFTVANSDFRKSRGDGNVWGIGWCDESRSRAASRMTQIVRALLEQMEAKA